MHRINNLDNDYHLAQRMLRSKEKEWHTDIDRVKAIKSATSKTQLMEGFEAMRRSTSVPGLLDRGDRILFDTRIEIAMAKIGAKRLSSAEINQLNQHLVQLGREILDS